MLSCPILESLCETPQALFPAKFALPFTLGSACNMGAVASLRGYRAQAAHMLSKERLPFSTVYVGSMLATLWAALVAHSYFLCMIAAMVSDHRPRFCQAWLGWNAFERFRHACGNMGGRPRSPRKVLRSNTSSMSILRGFNSTAPRPRSPPFPQVQVTALLYYMFSYFPGVRWPAPLLPAFAADASECTVLSPSLPFVFTWSQRNMHWAVTRTPVLAPRILPLSESTPSFVRWGVPASFCRGRLGSR